MTTTTYYGQFLVTPLDPAYADLWGTPLNNVQVTWDAALGRCQLSNPIVYPFDTTYTLMLNTRFPGTIKSMTHKTNSGTLTAAVKINGSPVTGLSAVSVTSSKATATATAANTFVDGDDITMTVSSTSGVTEFAYNVWIDRTGAGTA